MQALPRLLLLLSGFVLVGLGAFFLLVPSRLAAVDLYNDTGVARAEIRAMYGGLEVGLGLLMFWCAAARERWRAGLAASLAIYVGLAAGRAVGVALEGEVGTHGWLLAIEAVAIVLCFVALAAETKASRS